MNYPYAQTTQWTTKNPYILWFSFSRVSRIFGGFITNNLFDFWSSSVNGLLPNGLSIFVLTFDHNSLFSPFSNPCTAFVLLALVKALEYINQASRFACEMVLVCNMAQHSKVVWVKWRTVSRIWVGIDLGQLIVRDCELWLSSFQRYSCLIWKFSLQF